MTKISRGLITAAALLTLGLVTACGGPAVEPGTGPAATAEPADPEPTVDGGQDPTPEEDTPTETPPEVATFKDKYVYTDGLQVEVIKIENRKFTRKEAEYSDEEGEKYGDPYTKFTIRVKNGSASTIDMTSIEDVSYGPDGTAAEKSYQLDLDDGLDGKLLPGKSRSTTVAFLVPTKYRSDVVLEFTTDFDHESAVFAGSTL